MSIVNEKIEQAIAILDEMDIDMWLTFVRESSYNPDPALDLIFGSHCTWHSAFIITRTGKTTAIVGSLEVPNTKTVGAYQEVIGYVDSVEKELLAKIKEIDPNRIAINYSENSVMADGLSHGMWLALNGYLEGTPYKDRLVSSELILSALRGRKSDEELRRLVEACDITQEIFKEVSRHIKPGLTERELADFILSRVEARGLEPAWEPAHCPAVFTGPESAGAHAEPTDRVIEKGHILNIDFGVKKDGYCADLQRTWYILRDGETDAPEEVKRGYNTIIEGIAKAAKFIKPGVQGHEVDSVCRKHIVDQGYEEYPHALGHQVGRAGHDGGGLLAPEWERYGDLPYLPVEVRNVFTIEPRLTVKGYGVATVEEEIVVTEDGFKYLSTPQKEIYLIK